VAACDSWHSDISFFAEYEYRTGECESVEATLSGDCELTLQSNGVLVKKGDGLRFSRTFVLPPLSKDIANGIRKIKRQPHDVVMNSKYFSDLRDPEGNPSQSLVSIGRRDHGESVAQSMASYFDGMVQPLFIFPESYRPPLSLSKDLAEEQMSTAVSTEVLGGVLVRINGKLAGMSATKIVRVSTGYSVPFIESVELTNKLPNGNDYFSISLAKDIKEMKSGPVPSTVFHLMKNPKGKYTVHQWRATELREVESDEDFSQQVPPHTEISGLRRAEGKGQSRRFNLLETRDEDLASTEPFVEPKASDSASAGMFLAISALVLGVIAFYRQFLRR